MRPVTVSEVLTFDQCPQMWAWKYVRGIAEEPTAAQRLGQALHTWFAERLRTGLPPGKLSERVHPDDLEDAEAIDLALPEWERRFSDPPWEEVVMVERELTMSVGDLQLLGKPDAVVRWMGKYWHTQHKSVGRSVPVEKFAMSVQKSLHEGLYCTMLEHNGYHPTTGTMLNAVRKLSANTIKKSPGQALHLEFLPVTLPMREGAMQDLIARAREMRALESTLDSSKPRAYRDRTACNGRFGNSRCPYYGVCWEGQEPEEFPQQDPLERYRKDGEA